MCKHENFSAAVNVLRSPDGKQFAMEVSAICTQCATEVKFPTVAPNTDLIEARAGKDNYTVRVKMTCVSGGKHEV